MACYLMKYKGKYRILPNTNGNPIPRDENDNIDKSFDDIYIKCASKMQIYNIGNGILEFYSPSLGRGRNIMRAIYKDKILKTTDEVNFPKMRTIYDILIHNKLFVNIYEGDEELFAQFNSKFLVDDLDKYFRPVTSGASISPFSTRNIKKADYEIPEIDVQKYAIVMKNKGISKDNNNVYIIKQINTEFDDYIAKKLSNKKVKYDTKQEREKARLKNKEFYHSVGIWDEYIKFIENYKN